MGSSNHLVSEFFQMLTGAKFLLVPYKGAAPAMTDLIGGQVETFFDQASTSVAQVQGGKIRALAVTAAGRMAALPDVPTFKEAGIDGFEILNVTGLVGPAGMDPGVVAKIREATVKALDNPGVKDVFAKLGVLIEASTPQAFAAFIREDLDRWARVVKEAKYSGELTTRDARSSPSHKQYHVRHHCHQQRVGVERQAGHVDDRAADMVGIHARLDHHASVGLQHALALHHAFGEWVATLSMSTWPKRYPCLGRSRSCRSRDLT